MSPIPYFLNGKREAQREGRSVLSNAELDHEARLVQQLRTQALESGGPKFNLNSTVAKGQHQLVK